VAYVAIRRRNVVSNPLFLENHCSDQEDNEQSDADQGVLYLAAIDAWL
jgi:hypothetical protein